MENFIKSLGIKLIFPQGPKCNAVAYYKLTYLLKCDPTNTGIHLEIIKKNSNCDIVFEFLTKYTCLSFAYNGNFSGFDTSGNGVQATAVEGVSYQTILFWILLIFIIYLISFSIYNYRSNPEDGVIKSLPHREFWSAFFFNTIYGCEITYNYIKLKFC